MGSHQLPSGFGGSDSGPTLARDAHPPGRGHGAGSGTRTRDIQLGRVRVEIAVGSGPDSHKGVRRPLGSAGLGHTELYFPHEDGNLAS
jgi:hypothetical protein